MKKTLTAITLATIVGLSSSFALAGDGIIVAGRNAPTTNTCTSNKDGIIVAGREGIIVAGLVGIIVAGFTGIYVDGTAPAPCEAAREGILVSD